MYIYYSFQWIQQSLLIVHVHALMDGPHPKFTAIQYRYNLAFPENKVLWLFLY
jgi:hypothetical protein